MDKGEGDPDVCCNYISAWRILILRLCTSTFQGAVSTTTRAHRLCRKAYLQGGQDMQVAQLLSIFKVHYGEGRDIADIELLSELAAQNNLMSKEQVRNLHFFQHRVLLTDVCYPSHFSTGPHHRYQFRLPHSWSRTNLRRRLT